MQIYVPLIPDFNPRSSCEERLLIRLKPLSLRTFQSTLLMRGATVGQVCAMSEPGKFQSTLLMRGATRRIPTAETLDCTFQSTLLMRGATGFTMCASVFKEFQSTLLMRGATSSLLRTGNLRDDFNPRSSCEERRCGGDSLCTLRTFQSTLLMRGATATGSVFSTHPRFQSTLLMRGATSDPNGYKSIQELFQSTLLMRGATKELENFHYLVMISIHAPHARSDMAGGGAAAQKTQFQSTLLMRGATI